MFVEMTRSLGGMLEWGQSEKTAREVFVRESFSKIGYLCSSVELLWAADILHSLTISPK